MAVKAPGPSSVLRHHTCAVTAICFADLQFRSLLISGDSDGASAIWNLERRRVVAEWAPHPNMSVLKVHTFSPHKMLSQGRDGTIKIWDISRIDSTKVSCTFSEPERTFETGSYHFCECSPTRWPVEGGGGGGASPVRIVCQSEGGVLLPNFSDSLQALRPVDGEVLHRGLHREKRLHRHPGAMTLALTRGRMVLFVLPTAVDDLASDASQALQESLLVAKQLLLLNRESAR
mmetsp:Transcript_4654/g.5576  ORF Transcript_4654/g.5576 Transcript_4654/m.5576 type:complete len:232 (-) Transcript_4654:246-941(-)